MGQTLLSGSSKGELYHLWPSPSSSDHQLFFGEQTTHDTWHAHLGHPSYTIVNVLN